MKSYHLVKILAISDTSFGSFKISLYDWHEMIGTSNINSDKYKTDYKIIINHILPILMESLNTFDCFNIKDHTLRFRNFIKQFSNITQQSIWSYKLMLDISNFIKKETLTKVCSCEFREVFKNTFLTEHLRVTLSSCYKER